MVEDEYRRPTPDDVDQPRLAEQPPDPWMAVSAVLQSWRAKRGRWPQAMPENVGDAVSWWMSMQEPMDDRFELPRRVGTGKGGTRWATPYQARLCYTLAIFLRLPEDRQRIVVAAREDGYWWRGEYEDVQHGHDKVWLFLLVLEQYELQTQLGKDAYREYALKSARKAAARLLPYDKGKSLGGDWVTGGKP